MAFFMSPLVQVNEIDLTGTITSAAEAIGCLLLRNTYKGQENRITTSSNTAQLVDEYGFPTENSYEDLLSGAGFLSQARTLRSTRVMPGSAMYSARRVKGTYNGGSTQTAGLSATTRELIDLDTAMFPNTEFPQQISGAATFGAQEVLWMIASSRGAWGDNVRFMVFDKYFYDAVKYFDETLGMSAFPPSYEITTYTQAVTGAVKSIYDNYVDSTKSEDLRQVYPLVKSVGIPITSDKEFVIVVQENPQSSSSWKTQEIWHVSIDETAVDDQGNTKFCETIVNNRSKYIRIALNPTLKITSDMTATQRASRRMIVGMDRLHYLTDGNNGVWTPQEETAALIDALKLYENPEQVYINLFLDGNKPEEVKNRMVTICDTIRKDAMVILDVPKYTVIDNQNPSQAMVQWRRGFTSTVFNPNSSYAAIYGNWLEVYDQWNRKYRWIPASGYVGAVYAYSDYIAKPWYAPAGLNRGVINGVRKLAFNPTQDERDTMYVDAINPIVSFQGQGKVIWGQKTTLDKNSAFNRVNVRRLFLTLEKAIATRAKYYIMDPNDETSRVRFVNEVLPYLRSVQSDRGIYAFNVICDDTNNTAELIDQEIMRADIFIQPTRTTEMIQLNFIGLQSGAVTMDESVLENTQPA